ncbi:hypothetical protein CDAR_536541 [Caerostris darwini]|uniref:Uncharacterized protein n=1 Tax=Caerostris darwini TaxID=1538125 RepID=A0AAV4V0Z1_9ARAC|nr:hypothetical protein CDAR_536541 [Caerostris darwini]
MPRYCFESFDVRITFKIRRTTTFLASTAGIISVTCDGQTRRWNGANQKRDSFAHEASFQCTHVPQIPTVNIFPKIRAYRGDSLFKRMGRSIRSRNRTPQIPFECGLQIECSAGGGSREHRGVFERGVWGWKVIASLAMPGVVR